MDSLKASVLTAFYTPAPIIDALATSLRERGVKIKKFLEPSAGKVLSSTLFLKMRTIRARRHSPLRKIC